MGKRFGSRKVKVAVAVVAALGVTGAAMAYYTASGSGSGNASVGGSPADLTITASTPSAGLLYPGSTGEVDATISNPNTFPVRVNSLVLGAGGIAPDSGHSSCEASALHFTTQTNGGTGWDVPARVGAVDGTLDVQLADAISMDNDAANECQGATFTVSLATGP
ncbi:MAG TPA: hypothetical protein VFA88_13040 [Gaiellaceae bacterium]|nr:hypothetical protein [Gaiellaceae bacterium]